MVTQHNIVLKNKALENFMELSLKRKASKQIEGIIFFGGGGGANI